MWNRNQILSEIQKAFINDQNNGIDYLDIPDDDLAMMLTEAYDEMGFDRKWGDYIFDVTKQQTKTGTLKSFFPGSNIPSSGISTNLLIFDNKDEAANFWRAVNPGLAEAEWQQQVASGLPWVKDSYESWANNFKESYDAIEVDESQMPPEVLRAYRYFTGSPVTQAEAQVAQSILNNAIDDAKTLSSGKPRPVLFEDRKDLFGNDHPYLKAVYDRKMAAKNNVNQSRESETEMTRVRFDAAESDNPLDLQAQLDLAAGGYGTENYGNVEVSDQGYMEGAKDIPNDDIFEYFTDQELEQYDRTGRVPNSTLKRYKQAKAAEAVINRNEAELNNLKQQMDAAMAAAADDPVEEALADAKAPVSVNNASGSLSEYNDYIKPSKMAEALYALKAMPGVAIDSADEDLVGVILESPEAMEAFWGATNPGMSPDGWRNVTKRKLPWVKEIGNTSGGGIYVDLRLNELGDWYDRTSNRIAVGPAINNAKEEIVDVVNRGGINMNADEARALAQLVRLQEETGGPVGVSYKQFAKNVYPSNTVGAMPSVTKTPAAPVTSSMTADEAQRLSQFANLYELERIGDDGKYRSAQQALADLITSESKSKNNAPVDKTPSGGSPTPSPSTTKWSPVTEEILAKQLPKDGGLLDKALRYATTNFKEGTPGFGAGAGTLGLTAGGLLALNAAQEKGWLEGLINTGAGLAAASAVGGMLPMKVAPTGLGSLAVAGAGLAGNVGAGLITGLFGGNRKEEQLLNQAMMYANQGVPMNQQMAYQQQTYYG